MEVPESPKLKPVSSEQVRTKFLSVIGIESSAVTDHSATPPKARHMMRQEWTHPRQEQANRFEEALKYNKEEDVLYSPKRKNSTSNGDKKKRKAISFNQTVKVVPIPKRDEYSNRVRSRIWSNAVEIHQNATRNSIEFAAEGWDWRACMEDEYMFVDVRTGELIHPVHAQQR
jgi:hypothetical protein